MATVEENYREFESAGFARIKHLALNNGLRDDQRSDAHRWLAQKEEEIRLHDAEQREFDRERQIAFEKASTRLAESTLRATNRGVFAAIAAAVIAFIAAVISLFAWLYPH